MSYHTSLLATGGKFTNRTRLFVHYEKEMQGDMWVAISKRKRKTLRKGSKPLSQKKLRAKIQNDGKFSEAFRQRQDGDDATLAALGNQVIEDCESLFLLAEEGNQLAAEYLAELAIKSSKGLERVVKHH